MRYCTQENPLDWVQIGWARVHRGRSVAEPEVNSCPPNLNPLEGILLGAIPKPRLITYLQTKLVYMIILTKKIITIYY